MLSRVADSLYWMARYLERAEHTSRLVAVQTEMMLDQHAYSSGERWSRILEGLGDPVPVADEDNLTHTLLYDPRCRASIVSCISSARENCRQARNEVSSQMWEQLNRMFHEVRRFSTEGALVAQPIEFLQFVEQGVHTFRGINDSTMSHSEGWQFVEVGQYLERAINTATLLDAHFRHQSTHLEWIGLLRSCTAFEAYLAEHTVDIRPEKAAEFLLLDPAFPHSIRFSVDRLNGAMANMPASDERGSRATRLAGRLRASLSYIQIEEMMADGIRSHLDEVKRQGAAIHAALQEGYIDYRVDTALSA